MSCLLPRGSILSIFHVSFLTGLVKISEQRGNSSLIKGLTIFFRYGKHMEETNVSLQK